MGKEWDLIIWSDESKFELSGGHQRTWVWRREDQRMDPDCLVPTLKDGKKSVMVWGCFTRFGVGPLVRIEGRLAAKDYIAILQANFLPYLASLTDPKRFTLQEDDAPIHTAKKTEAWRKKNKISLLPWPAQSPDLNPIENLWAALDYQVDKVGRKPKNENDLFAILQEAWQNIPVANLETLVDSMPKRVKLVVEANGYPIKY